MKRKIFALILAIVMLSGVAIIATADETHGSIEFESGSIIINPPDPPPADDCFCCNDCACTCECQKNGGTGSTPSCCPCTCTDKDDYDKFFSKHRVANNLFFGEHELTVFGTFDSANKRNASNELIHGDHDTTRTGEYTGVEVVNKTGDTAHISVAISEFTVGTSGPTTLTGFELRLMQEAAILRDDSQQGGTPIEHGFIAHGFGGGIDFVLEAGEPAQRILNVGSAREVKAAWFGLFDIEPGTPRQPGVAQATLTWTGVAAPG